MESYQYYNNLLSLSYGDLLKELIEKYGKVTDDYFKEKSYIRFLNGEIKNPGKGKYTRSMEGLYCHHIFENKYENISNKDFIKEFQYPYELQKKENLVYCNLIEHLILHALIMKETGGKLGTNGFAIFIRPMVEDWYIVKRKKPKAKWYQAVFDRGFLFKDDAIQLLKDIDEMLMIYAKSKVEYRVNRERLEFQRENELDLEKTAKFDSEYPNLKSKNITYKISRKDLIKHLYEINSVSDQITYKKYYEKLNPFTRDQLLERLNNLISG